MRTVIATVASIGFAAPALALEPERREAIVTHNRVWDGHAYKENFVPSTAGELFLMSDVANAVNFVRTQEYYWPLARQTYVALDRQHDEVAGSLVIRDSQGVVSEVEREPFSIVYPEGAVRGRGELVWGAAAAQAYAEFREQEQEFVSRLAAAQRERTAYETALREAASARLRGEGVQEVPPPPQAPEPLLRLVTQPQSAFRVELPPGRYEAHLVENGTEVAGTRTALQVIDDAGSTTTVLDIVPEERWTRPIQSNRPEDRIYVRPGARFFVTAHEASRYREADYVRVVTPQGSAPRDREIWVRRSPSEARQMHVGWDGEAGGADVPLTALKVDQTGGSSFGYRVRTAEPGDLADLSAFPVRAPENGLPREGSLRIETVGGSVEREIVVVGQRNGPLAWSLALLPAVMGMFVGWRSWSARRST
jgi:hypothetical protein